MTFINPTLNIDPLGLHPLDQFFILPEQEAKPIQPRYVTTQSTDYAAIDSRATMTQIQKIIDGTAIYKGSGDRGDWEVERLYHLTEDLTRAVGDELESAGGSGPAANFAMDNFVRMKTMARNRYSTKNGKLLFIACSRLSILLPGNMLEALPPKVEGSRRFKLAVVTACKKLPYSARQHVGTHCVMIEIDRGSVQGVCSRPGARTLSIAAGLPARRLTEVVLHEIAHSFLKHKFGTDTTEREARNLAGKWMRLQ